MGDMKEDIRERTRNPNLTRNIMREFDSAGAIEGRDTGKFIKLDEKYFRRIKEFAGEKPEEFGGWLFNLITYLTQADRK